MELRRGAARQTRRRVRDYTMTAAVWLRGTLLDEYGTDWRDINWYANSEQRFPALARRAAGTGRR